jgi:malic enzyme
VPLSFDAALVSYRLYEKHGGHMDYYKESLKLHETHQGKLAVVSKVPLANKDDLSTAYTPGVRGYSDSVPGNRRRNDESEYRE